jgi:hypothetical protein
MRECRWMHLGDAAVRLAWRLLWSWRRKDPGAPTRLLLLLVVSALATVAPLSYSDVPDQVWLGGYYDGSEEDHALADLQIHQSAIEVLAVDPAPSALLVPIPSLPSEQTPPLRPLPARQTRAPPAS